MRTSAFAVVLDGVEFPVRRWEIVAAADGYGVDPLTRDEIEQIPDRAYSDVFDVLVALSSTPAHLARRRPL